MFFPQTKTYYILQLYRTGKITSSNFIANVLESRKLWGYRASAVMAIYEK